MWCEGTATATGVTTLGNPLPVVVVEVVVGATATTMMTTQLMEVEVQQQQEEEEGKAAVAAAVAAAVVAVTMGKVCMRQSQAGPVWLTAQGALPLSPPSRPCSCSFGTTPLTAGTPAAWGPSRW
jgi:hypothetical protein